MKHEKYQDIEFTKMWKELENLDVATVVMFTCSLIPKFMCKVVKENAKVTSFLVLSGSSGFRLFRCNLKCSVFIIKAI